MPTPNNKNIESIADELMKFKKKIGDIEYRYQYFIGTIEFLKEEGIITHDKNITDEVEIAFTSNIEDEKAKQKIVRNIHLNSPVRISLLRNKEKSPYVNQKHIAELEGVVKYKANKNKLNKFLLSRFQYIKENSKQLNDIFIAAPKNSLAFKVKRYNEFIEGLKVILKHDISDEKFQEVKKFAEIKFFGAELSVDVNEITQRFSNQVQALKKALEEEKGLSVICPSLPLNLEEAKQQIKSYVFKEDEEAINNSKIFLIISPYPRLFSSAFIEEGMAIGKQKPIICITPNSNGDYVPELVKSDIEEKIFNSDFFCNFDEIRYLEKDGDEIPSEVLKKIIGKISYQLSKMYEKSLL